MKNKRLFLHETAMTAYFTLIIASTFRHLDMPVVSVTCSLLDGILHIILL